MIEIPTEILDAPIESILQTLFDAILASLDPTEYDTDLVEAQKRLIAIRGIRQILCDMTA